MSELPSHSGLFNVILLPVTPFVGPDGISRHYSGRLLHLQVQGQRRGSLANYLLLLLHYWRYLNFSFGPGHKASTHIGKVEGPIKTIFKGGKARHAQVAAYVNIPTMTTHTGM